MDHGYLREVKEIEIARLHLRYAHTRIHRPERVSSLASSIERFGQIIPVIALRQGVDSFVLIDGYLRVKAMMRCLRDTVVEVYKLWDRVEVFFKNQKVADHPRLLDKRETRITAKGHHPPFNRQRAHAGPCNEEKTLLGQQEWLDQFTVELKRRSSGRGVKQMRRLLDLKRTYPPEAFEKAVIQALRYGLYDLTRLEQMILSHVAGDFFTIEEDEEP